MSFLNLLRINHWIKNLFIFAPLIFSLNLTNQTLLYQSIWGFISFSLLTSSVYIINDIRDMERDREHPAKKDRPIAAGKIKVLPALAISLLLLAAGFYISLMVSVPFAYVLGIYLLNNILYSFYIKHYVILDIMSIALGFLLRVYGGAVLINVEASSWLLICTGLLSLFLGFGKRRNELTLLEENAVSHREVLEHYSIKFIDQMINVVTGATVIAYMLYTVADETVQHFGTNRLILTVPFVLYGIFRYLYLIYHKAEGGNPTKMVYKDKPLLIAVALWTITAILIIY